MTRHFLHFLSTLGETYWHIFYCSLVCFALEALWPRSGYTLRSRVRGAMFWALDGIIVVAAAVTFGSFITQLSIRPLVALNLNYFAESGNPILRYGTWVVAPIAALLLADFLDYWLHRAEHAIPLLWRFHRVHHSIRELSGVNSAPHFGDRLLQLPFVYLPMALVIHPIVGYEPLVLMAVLRMQGYYEHSCTRLHCRWLWFLMCDNQFHRIHHSKETWHFDRNFGAFSTLWDRLFGTAYFPARDEWPDVGLSDVDEPKTLRDYVMMPALPLEQAGIRPPMQGVAAEAAPPMGMHRA